ncbi:hypothetical protein JZ751_003865 [Albula glossodonta]|uniref:non-specific serine/threonine protein kinase n=1 Tax=Albula glossodonta TaxID=121402 RepID=A0A8T2P6D4_9TELE|nr:hypothetical protein JZ751_003865 [Albula glossodonta]
MELTAILKGARYVTLKTKRTHIMQREMEIAPRRQRTLGRVGQTGRQDKQPRKAEKEGGWRQQQSCQRKGRKRAREMCGEKWSDTKEERGRLKRSRRRSDALGWKGGSSQSSDPTPGPPPSPAHGTRIPKKAEDKEISSIKEGKVSQTGQIGPEGTPPNKAGEDFEEQMQILQRKGRKEFSMPYVERGNDIKGKREQPNVKHMSRCDQEEVEDCKKNDLSHLSNHDQCPSPTSANDIRTLNTAGFFSLYSVGELLGEGGCGSVYAGTRREDGKQVAIKYVTANFSKKHLNIPGESQPLPLEVALLEMVCRPPACSHVIQLLDWFEEPDRVILVLELPSPCLDVSKFTKQLGGYMEESLAQVIMQQVVQATKHCRDRGVLHRDIKSKNLLIQTDDLHVKLIDFGCGDLLKEAPYKQFAGQSLKYPLLPAVVCLCWLLTSCPSVSGTRPFRPPEWVMDGEYHGRPATVWSLGVLLFALVCGVHPFRREEDIIAADLRFKEGLSMGEKHWGTFGPLVGMQKASHSKSYANGRSRNGSSQDSVHWD